MIFTHFWDFWKIENILQVSSSIIVFHFVVDNHRAIMGWSWGDNGRSCETCQISKILTPPGSRKYQIFSVFRDEKHVFQNIECFVQTIVKKAISTWKSSHLMLNLTILCDRRTVSKKICRWSFRPTQISSKTYTRGSTCRLVDYFSTVSEWLRLHLD